MQPLLHCAHQFEVGKWEQAARETLNRKNSTEKTQPTELNGEKPERRSFSARRFIYYAQSRPPLRGAPLCSFLHLLQRVFPLSFPPHPPCRMLNLLLYAMQPSQTMRHQFSLKVLKISNFLPNLTCTTGVDVCQENADKAVKKPAYNVVQSVKALHTG